MEPYKIGQTLLVHLSDISVAAAAAYPWYHDCPFIS